MKSIDFIVACSVIYLNIEFEVLLYNKIFEKVCIIHNIHVHVNVLHALGHHSSDQETRIKVIHKFCSNAGWFSLINMIRKKEKKKEKRKKERKKERKVKIKCQLLSVNLPKGCPMPD